MLLPRLICAYWPYLACLLRSARRVPSPAIACSGARKWAQAIRCQFNILPDLKAKMVIKRFEITTGERPAQTWADLKHLHCFGGPVSAPQRARPSMPLGPAPVQLLRAEPHEQHSGMPRPRESSNPGAAASAGKGLRQRLVGNYTVDNTEVSFCIHLSIFLSFFLPFTLWTTQRWAASLLQQQTQRSAMHSFQPRWSGRAHGHVCAPTP